jgi:hypothetical protein
MADVRAGALGLPGEADPNQPMLDDAAASADLDARVSRAVVEMLYERNLLPALVAIPFAALIVGSFWSLLPARPALAWLCIKCLTALSRVALWRGFVRARRAGPVAPAQWASRYHLALVFDSLSWTLLGLASTAADGVLQLGVMIGSLIGIATVGSVTASETGGAAALEAALDQTGQGAVAHAGRGAGDPARGARGLRLA